FPTSLNLFRKFIPPHQRIIRHAGYRRVGHPLVISLFPLRQGEFKKCSNEVLALSRISSSKVQLVGICFIRQVANSEVEFPNPSYDEMTPPHLMTLADLSIAQINRSLAHAACLKKLSYPILRPNATTTKLPSNSLQHKSIPLLFSNGSTRTRISAETAASVGWESVVPQ
ncbi:hypothetical protein M407DRAFT_32868, partial [Tulasnella calospora MUT 4182]